MKIKKNFPSKAAQRDEGYSKGRRTQKTRQQKEQERENRMREGIMAYSREERWIWSVRVQAGCVRGWRGCGTPTDSSCRRRDGVGSWCWRRSPSRRQRPVTYCRPSRTRLMVLMHSSNERLTICVPWWPISRPPGAQGFFFAKGRHGRRICFKGVGCQSGVGTEMGTSTSLADKERHFLHFVSFEPKL